MSFLGCDLTPIQSSPILLHWQLLLATGIDALFPVHVFGYV